MDWCYLDYLELSAEEFAKFAAMPVITDADLECVDLDALCARLQQDDDAG